MSTPVLVSWSGGKDAAMALARVRSDPRWHVVGLLTTLTPAGRVSAHGLARAVIVAQAQALGLPLFEVSLPDAAPNALYEARLGAALAAAAARYPGLATLVFGDLFLADVRAWREALLARCGWQGLFPLWGEDTGALARRFISDGWRAVLCAVDTTRLDARFCGREFDAALLQALPASCDPCGERGEFHTCVYAGPLWRGSLALRRGRALSGDGRFRYLALAGVDRVEH